MRTKPTSLILIFLLGGCIGEASRRNAQILHLPAAPAREQGATIGLRAYAQQAAAEGRTTTSLIVSGNGMADGLDAAVSNNGVAVGELLNQESVWYEEADQILTWYKFRTIETLSTKTYVSCPDCTFDPSPPSGLLPLQSGEVLLAVSGGSALIDNVVVEVLLEDFPGLVNGQKYLLFMNLNPSSQIAEVIAPQGIVHVNSDNTFAPVIRLTPGATEPIINGLATQYGNSLVQLRAVLNPPSLYFRTTSFSNPSSRLCVLHRVSVSQAFA